MGVKRSIADAALVVTCSIVWVKVMVHVPTGQPVELPEPRKMSLGPSRCLILVPDSDNQCVPVDDEASHMDAIVTVGVVSFEESLVATRMDDMADDTAAAANMDGRRTCERNEFIFLPPP